MNCDVCQDSMVAFAEGLLDRETALQCQAHLDGCARCQSEYQAIATLQHRLIARGKIAAEVTLVQPVMRQVLKAKPERNSIMSIILKHRWGFGLGATASVAAVILLITLLSTPNIQAAATEVMAKGARAMAKLTSVHLRGKVRTYPADNFSQVGSECEPQTIELWKQWQPELKWRIEKPGRVAIVDGQSTLLYIKPPANTAMKFPKPSPSAFDTEWLHRIANLSNAITNEINNALAKHWKLGFKEERAADGRLKAIVTVEAKAGLPANDYLKNKFFDAADTRRVYRFDDQTELLEGVQVYLMSPAGEVLMFELEKIEYNQPIDPAVFHYDLPANVNWYKDELAPLPDNAKYAALSAEQAANAYFEALASQNWKEAEKFRRNAVTDQVKSLVDGLELVSLGKAFGSAGYDPDGRFVPYEIKLKGQVIKHNLALKKDKKTGRWFVDGGGF